MPTWSPVKFEVEPELGGYYRLLTKGREGFDHEFLAGERVVTSAVSKIVTPVHFWSLLFSFP